MDQNGVNKANIVISFRLRLAVFRSYAVHRLDMFTNEHYGAYCRFDPLDVVGKLKGKFTIVSTGGGIPNML